MSQTGDYIKVGDIMFNAAGFAGDTGFKNVPRGFYTQQINDAFRELNMETKMLDGHADFIIPKNLTIPLPIDCFDVKNVWVYSGDSCDFNDVRKVWWKRNYYTQGGQGYLANRTGHSINDPYYINDSFSSKANKENLDLIRYRNNNTVNNTLFYNIQNGAIMLSASCLAAGTKVHVNYNSSGCDVYDAPIIPRFFKSAIEDYTTEAVLRFRMVNEPSSAKLWMATQQLYDRRLDKNGFNGSWHTAVLRAKRMSDSERTDLAVYLGKAAWATGR